MRHTQEDSTLRFLQSTRRQCQYCRLENGSCGSEDECSSANSAFVVALIIIVVVLVLVLSLWCFLVQRKNLRRRLRVIKRLQKYAAKREQENAKKGITIGVAVPKHIPFKVAPIRSSY